MTWIATDGAVDQAVENGLSRDALAAVLSENLGAAGTCEGYL